MAVCKVQPNHIGMLRNLACVFLLGAFLSVLSGRTYCKRTIIRRNEPAAFWSAVLAYFLLGISILIGISVCQ